MTSCLECSENVEFSNKKQEYFENHKFPYPPLFCSECQNKKLSTIWSFSGLNRVAKCSNCKKEITLHFIPTGDSPIKCNNCHETTKEI